MERKKGETFGGLHVLEDLIAPDDFDARVRSQRAMWMKRRRQRYSYSKVQPYPMTHSMAAEHASITFLQMMTELDTDLPAFASRVKPNT